MNINIIKESSRGYQALRPIDRLYSSSRIIWFNEDVTNETATHLISELLILNEESSEPITLILNSPGGIVDAGLSVYDVITTLMTAPVNTLCAGLSASMAFVIFLAGKRRSILKHSRLMLHDPALAGGSLAGLKPLDLKNDVLDNLMKVRQKVGYIISERSGLSLEQVFELTEKDTYLTAEESLEKGFATDIITSPDDILFGKHRHDQ